jgi:hypothetical protein
MVDYINSAMGGVALLAALGLFWLMTISIWLVVLLAVVIAGFYGAYKYYT